MAQYSDEELKYIDVELSKMQISRQEQIDPKTLKEWVKNFYDIGYSAEHVCRMIRKAGMQSAIFKMKFSDITVFQDDIRDMPLIIPQKLLESKEDEAEKRKALSIMESSELCGRVRHELNISYIDFLVLYQAQKEFKSYEKFIEVLKEFPEMITCGKLTDPKPRRNKDGFTTLGDMVREVLSS